MLLARAFASLLVVAACAGPAPAPTSAPADRADPAPSGVRLVVLVRHAEKVDDSHDPALTAAGKARAQCLADLLAPAAVSDVLSTDYQRTRDTVGPVAAQHGRTLEVLKTDASGWVERLRALPPGAVAVVAGHSNTIPALVRDLTGQAVTLADDQYDRLFVLAVHDAGGSMLAMRYCERSPPGATMGPGIP